MSVTLVKLLLVFSNFFSASFFLYLYFNIPAASSNIYLLSSDFEFITTFENSYSCKPNPRYYLEVAEKLGLSPEECLMVGNDVRDDMIAETVGMKVFLLTDCLINVKNVDISSYPQGSFKELVEYTKTL